MNEGRTEERKEGRRERRKEDRKADLNLQLCERMHATAQSIRYSYEPNPDACVL